MNQKQWSLLFTWGIILLLLILAGSLPQLSFEPGRTFELDAERNALPLIAQSLYALILVSMSIAIFLLSLFLHRDISLRGLLPWLTIFLIAIFIAALAISQREPLEEEAAEEVQAAVDRLRAPVETPEPIDEEIEPLPLLETEPFEPPPTWIALAVSFGVALSLLLIVAMTVWFFWDSRQEPAFVMERLAQEAQETLDILYSGAKLRDAIIRCYDEMGRLVDQAHNVRRAATMTPREFERHLLALDLPQGPVIELTRLFEEVRYGHYPSGEPERQRAIDSLSAIAAACQEKE